VTPGCRGRLHQAAVARIPRVARAGDFFAPNRATVETGTSAPSAGGTGRSGGAVIRLGEAEIRGHGHPRSERLSTSPVSSPERRKPQAGCNTPAAACPAMSCSARLPLAPRGAAPPGCHLRRELFHPAAATSCSAQPPLAPRGARTCSCASPSSCPSPLLSSAGLLLPSCLLCSLVSIHSVSTLHGDKEGLYFFVPSTRG
jgi:hypothetical protein